MVCLRTEYCHKCFKYILCFLIYIILSIIMCTDKNNNIILFCNTSHYTVSDAIYICTLFEPSFSIDDLNLKPSYVSKRQYIPVQKDITLRDLQKVFSYVERLSVEQCFMLKRNPSIQNDENKWGNCFQFPM